MDELKQNSLCQTVLAKRRICGTGMSYLWNMDTTQISKEWLKHTIKLKLSDIGNQVINSEINDYSQCVTYKALNTQNEIKHYLKVLNDFKEYQLQN